MVVAPSIESGGGFIRKQLLKNIGGTDELNTTKMKKTWIPIFLLVLIPGTDKVEEFTDASIGDDGSGNNQLTTQTMLKDDTKGTDPVPNGDKVVRALTPDENTYWTSQQTASQAAAQHILDTATANIVGGTIPNATAGQ